MPTFHHHAVSVFADQSTIKAALDQLKQAGFLMHQVTVVAKQIDPQDAQIQSGEQFKHRETIEELEQGAVDAGVLGDMTGMLIGLTTLFVPGIGAVAFLGAKAAIVGALAGTCYGSVQE